MSAHLTRIQLRFIDAAGHSRAIEIGADETTAMRDGVGMTAHREDAIGGTVVRASIENRGVEAVRLTSAIFEIATGFAPSAPARFFKQGYQSWSASGGRDVTLSRTHPRDTAHFITRVNHQ